MAAAAAAWRQMTNANLTDYKPNIIKRLQKETFSVDYGIWENHNTHQKTSEQQIRTIFWAPYSDTLNSYVVSGAPTALKR